MGTEKLDIEKIVSVMKEIKQLIPPPQQELRCGKLFEKALLDSCSELTIKGVPFASAVVNPTFCGIKVVHDETLPPNVARIGDQFIRLIV